MLWDAEKAKVVKVFKGNEEGIWNLNYTKNGKNFVSASPSGECKMWDVRAGKQTNVYKAHKKRVYKAMLSADDTKFVSCGSNRMICIWDLRKAKAPLLINNDSKSCIMACDWSTDQTHIISSTVEGIINGLNI